MTHTVTLIPGDGIGPAITEATLSVLAAAGAPTCFRRRLSIRSSGTGSA